MAPLQNLHIRYILKSLSPVIDDVSLNFNYFTTFTTQDLTDVSNLLTQITSKINTINSGAGSTVAQWISPVIARSATATAIEVYDVSGHLNGSPAGSPVLVSSMTLATTTSNVPCPEGVAAVVTLQAPYGTDVEFTPGARPRARDRGRIYFGPLAGSGLATEAVTNRAYISASVRTDLTQWIKAANVLTSTPHTVVWNLGVWSRKNAVMKSLQEAWVDDRPDYQRRRADQGATRTIIGLP